MGKLQLNQNEDEFYPERLRVSWMIDPAFRILVAVQCRGLHSPDWVKILQDKIRLDRIFQWWLLFFHQAILISFPITIHSLGILHMQSDFNVRLQSILPHDCRSILREWEFSRSYDWRFSFAYLFHFDLLKNGTLRYEDEFGIFTFDRKHLRLSSG